MRNEFRKKIRKIGAFVTCIFYYFACFEMLFTRNVYAYIDPSATTFIIQAVAGALIAIGACATIFRHKIKALFNKNKKTQKKEIHVLEDDSQEGSKGDIAD